MYITKKNYIMHMGSNIRISFLVMSESFFCTDCPLKNYLLLNCVIWASKTLVYEKDLKIFAQCVNF